MSLRLMRERMRVSGDSPRSELIRDGQNLLIEELEHDSSYSPTIFFWNPVSESHEKQAKLRLYGRKYSSLNGNYQNFLTTYDNPLKIGEYLHDTKDDTYWLVYNSFNVNDIHYEGKMIQCNYLLKWQLTDGRIIKRWANIVSASKYDVGENGNGKIILSSNNYTILIGYCEEGFELEGKRVFIDMKPVNPTKVFKITRSDDVIYNSEGMGFILSFIADKTEFNPEKDNQELRICDYTNTASLLPNPPESNETEDLRVTVSGRRTLKNSYKRTYSVNFADKNGNAVNYRDVGFVWEVKADFNIAENTYDNKIELYVNNENLIGESFALRVMINGNAAAETEILITE